MGRTKLILLSSAEDREQRKQREGIEAREKRGDGMRRDSLRERKERRKNGGRDARETTSDEWQGQGKR